MRNTAVVKKDYAYNNNGSLSYAQDQINAIFGRLNIYDQAGRIKQAMTGLEARGRNSDRPDDAEQ